MTEIYRSDEVTVIEQRPTVVTIGNFDGMHTGHQRLFKEAVERARTRQARSVGLTFEPHPMAFFRPDAAPERLTPMPYKAQEMARQGVDAVVVWDFDERLSSRSPTAFVEDILVDTLGAVHVVVGRDFRFGKKRAGDVETLEALGEEFGFSVTVADVVTYEGEKIGSTRIREALLQGAIREARAMLGRPMRLWGEVVEGEARGRALGFPTANLEVVDMATPTDGVYATTLGRQGEPHWAAITNIGHRPTFDGQERTVETFVLDDAVGLELDLYGDDVELDFYQRIRGERAFESPQALVAQIESDVEEARAILKREGIDGAG